MPRYRVTLTRSSVEIVEANNQYQAAIVARDLFGDSVEVANVAPAVGRPPVLSPGRRAAGRRHRRRADGGRDIRDFDAVTEQITGDDCRLVLIVGFDDFNRRTGQ